MRLRLEELSDSEFQVMHGSVVRLLSEVGVLFESAEAREILEKAGNRVGYDARVHLGEKYVESILALVPKDGFVMAGREEGREMRVAVDSMCFRPSTGMPFVLEYETRRRRAATMEDARKIAILIDALDGYEMVNSVVSPADAPGTLTNVHRFVNAHRHSVKPSDITVMGAEEVSAIGRIAAVIRGSERELREKPLTLVDVAMITPLRCAEEQAEAMLECARLGLPVEVLTSPALGLTAPITLAGGAVLAIAECIAAMCLMYEIAPGLGVVNTARVSPVNMRTTAYNYGAPEFGMGSALVAGCCARYGLPTNLYGLGTVAKCIGAQSAMEKTFSGLMLALSHPHMITGAGMLDNAMCTSLEQIAIDHEAIRFLRRITQGIAVDEEAVGVEAIVRAMRSGEGSLLTDDHTMKHLLAGEVLDCSLGQWSWSSYEQWEEAGGPDLFDRAHEKVQETLEGHRAAPLGRDVEKAIERVLEELERG